MAAVYDEQSPEFAAQVFTAFGIDRIEQADR